jgi:predicted SAM-dependent methyltransferase
MRPMKVLRQLANRLSDVPVVGHFARIGLVAWDGPKIVGDIWDQQARIDQSHGAQLAGLVDAVATLTRRQEELQSRVDTALRSSSESRQLVNDLGKGLRDHHGSIDYLMGRVEFIRREMMFELRHGAKPPRSEADALEVQPKVVSTEKLSAARAGRLRLNLGCGHICLDGFLNVDRRELPGVDIVADATGIPIESGVVDEIFSAHMLEHFPQEQLRRELLPYWKTLLKPHGIFRAVVPDAEAMIREYGKGNMPYADLREVTFGAQDYDGDFHFNMFTPAHLSDLLVEAGFSDVRVIEAGRRNGKCFEFEILGVSETSQ